MIKVGVAVSFRVLYLLGGPLIWHTVDMITPIYKSYIYSIKIKTGGSPFST